MLCHVTVDMERWVEFATVWGADDALVDMPCDDLLRTFCVYSSSDCYVPDV
jgi:hypothetical protein